MLEYGFMMELFRKFISFLIKKLSNKMYVIYKKRLMQLKIFSLGKKTINKNPIYR